MASDAANREACRDALATLLAAELVTELEEAQAALNYQAGTLVMSPVVMVVSAGTLRKQAGMNSERHANKFRFLVKVYVADAATADGWTEQNVEDALDLLNKRVADVVMDNRSPAQNASVPWTRLYLEEAFSTITAAPDLGGNPYLIEATPVIAEVYD